MPARLWVLPIVWLGVIAGGIALVLFLREWLPYLVAAAILLVVATWVLVSTLSPAIPDRTCPRCGGKGLVKMRRGELGVHCQLCGFRDDEMHVAYLDEW